MYPEFIAIFVGLGIIFLIQVATIICCIVLLKRKDEPRLPDFNSSGKTGKSVCFNCGFQYDSSLRVCPRCGKTRAN